MAMATRQASIVTRSTASYYMRYLLFLIITVVMVNTPALAGSSPPPSTLVLYGIQKRFPPNETVVEVASPSGDLSALEFGTIFVLSDPLRESPATESPVVGTIAGLLVTEKDFSFYSSGTYVVNTPSLSGSITAQGVVDQRGEGEQAITGGTYDFRWARGYVEISSVFQDLQVAVIKLVFHIKYD